MSEEYCVEIKKRKKRGCVEPDCPASVRDKTDKCIAHGGGKRCVEPDCPASAQGKTDKCIAHGGGKRCPNCIDWIDSRCGSIAYDGYCATCFKQYNLDIAFHRRVFYIYRFLPWALIEEGKKLTAGSVDQK